VGSVSLPSLRHAPLTDANTRRSVAQIDIGDADWHSVVFHGKANTVSLGDGLQEVWIDGKKVLGQTSMRWRTTRTLAWNRVKFEDYFSDPPTTTEYTWGGRERLAVASKTPSAPAASTP